ncbi:4'-phosphopantetheinyl transferase superfamily protein [Christiangramia forsetii]|uniref:Holo-[acyl-carrier-protein] synthase family protein n=2 Tax=Christiangramia forsetii TaxID=411153 RepID=A0M1T3_CHRFK|nr:4'-phosphopantetheinyl transferase superfamily protein [Christiangramia forsetii]GGG45419.1 hypothetical protein GCM10011532_31760 [Christiangramia forsetii]CAL66578.1 holo-[acyl-carrier-protein] synthase family protein [Christiangramia forsetii KT0803]
MIGNDIIDLSISLPTNKSEDFRFLKKVFSEEEIVLIKESENPEILLWQLWSMKEAAYKAHQRAFKLPRKLNPIAYRCSLNSDNKSGIVKVDHSRYSTTTEINANYIHSSIDAKEEVFQKIYFNISHSKKDLRRNISAGLSVDESFIKVYKNAEGLPCIHLKKEDKILPISLSHHGNFTAFIIPLINS